MNDHTQENEIGEVQELPKEYHAAVAELQGLLDKFMEKHHAAIPGQFLVGMMGRSAGETLARGFKMADRETRTAILLSFIMNMEMGVRITTEALLDAKGMTPP